MAKIIEAQAILTAKDATGGAFASVSKKLSDVSKNGKLVGEAMSGMAKHISAMEGRLSKIQNFNQLRTGLADARTKFRAAEAEVQRLGRAMAQTAAPTRQMTRAYEMAQRQVSAASRAMQMQASAAIAAKRAVETLGVPLNRLGQFEDRLKARIEGANAALVRQAQAARQADRATSGAAGRAATHAGASGGSHGAGAIAGLHVGGRMIGAGVHSANDLGNAINQARMSGMSEEQVSETRTLAGELSKKYPTVSQAEIIRMVQSQTAVTGDFHHAKDAITDNVRLRATVQMKDPGKDLNQDFEYLNKGMEILNQTKSPEIHHAAMQSIAKAANFFGHTLSLEDWYQMAIKSKGAASNMSTDFMFGVLPTLGSEMKGSAAGESIYSFNRAIVGGKMSHSAIQTLDSMGLVDGEKVDRTKTGSIKGLRPGAVNGWRVAQSDPDKWVSDYLLPAFEKKGITDPGERAATVRSMFSSGRSAQLVQMLIDQAARIQKDRAGIGRAEGLEAAEKNQTRDTGTAIAGVTTAFENLTATLTGPVLQSAVPALNALSSTLNNLAKWGQENPGKAGAAGVGVVAGAMGAVSYGTTKALGWLGRAIGFGGQAVTAAEGAMTGAATIGAGASAGGRLAGGWLGEMAGGAGRFLGPLGAVYSAMTSLEAAKPTTEANRYYRWDPEFQGVYERSHRAQEEYRRDPEAARGRSMAQGAYNNERMAAELKGSITVENVVKVEAGDGLIATITKRVVSAMGPIGVSNGPGSVGSSSPDASAPAVHHGRGDQ